MKPEIKNGKAVLPDDYRKAEKIIDLVCEHWGITIGQIRANTKREEIMYPRQVAMYIMRERTNLSRREIGQYFSKDHSTVFHAWQIIGEQYEIYDNVRNDIDEIETKI